MIVCLLQRDNAESDPINSLYYIILQYYILLRNSRNLKKLKDAKKLHTMQWMQQGLAQPKNDGAVSAG